MSEPDAFGLSHDRPHKDPGNARPANAAEIQRLRERIAKLEKAKEAALAALHVQNETDAALRDAVAERLKVIAPEAKSTKKEVKAADKMVATLEKEMQRADKALGEAVSAYLELGGDAKDMEKAIREKEGGDQG